jgi:protein TonB
MGEDRNGHEVSTRGESLEDLVYRPELSLGNTRIRNANPRITVPVTLLGYLMLGFLGWRLVQQARPLAVDGSKQVIVDLEGLGDGEAPPALAPPPPPTGGGPPPGALLREDAPPPLIPANADAVPEKPPEQLPTQDQSNVAFPAASQGTAPATGEGTLSGKGDGSSIGTGLGQAGGSLKTVRRDYESVKEKFAPKPVYPPFARKAGIQGRVLVEVTIGVDGVPIAAKAVEGPPMLRAGAEALAMQHRYYPALENGEPVAVIIYKPFNFQLTGP